MQQGDEKQKTQQNENIRGTLTAFNPDLSHTSLSRMFSLKLLFVTFHISVFLYRSSSPQREHFPKPEARIKILINQMKLYMRTLDWKGRGEIEGERKLQYRMHVLVPE